VNLAAAYLEFCSYFKIEPKTANKYQYHASVQVAALHVHNLQQNWAATIRTIPEKRKQVRLGHPSHVYLTGYNRRFWTVPKSPL